MANHDTANRLSTAVESIKTLDRDRLLRPSLGELSLAAFGDNLDDIASKGDFAKKLALSVPDSALSQATSTFEGLVSLFNQQSSRNNEDYVSQRTSFLQQIESRRAEIRNFWPDFIAIGLEARGFLTDEGIKDEYKNAVRAMEDSARATLAEVKEQAEKTIDEAKRLAEDIENKARKTATKISVKDAQDEFGKALPIFDQQVKQWSGISIVVVGAFIGAAIFFSLQTPTSSDFVIYETGIRITILAAIGAAATFCLRILRAQMHMREQNRHRQRIANSISSFVESAWLPEQRDSILARLVDAVVSFGNSGLITDADDSMSGGRHAADSVLKTINIQK